MATQLPIFPMAETQHYSDYGFDPQIDYFQVLHEARRHGKREAGRPPDAFRFKLQKPISKDDSRRSAKTKKRGGSRWWRNALLFWKRKGNDRGGNQAAAAPCSTAAYPSSSPCYAYPSPVASSPVYMTDSGGGWGGVCSGSLRLAGSGKVKMPYLCLRDIAAMDDSPSHPSPAVPIYLVT